MDAGDLIYFGIIAIVIISSIVRKAKKAQATESKEYTPPKNPWEEIMRELTQTEEPFSDIEPKSPNPNQESQEIILDDEEQYYIKQSDIKEENKEAERPIIVSAQNKTYRNTPAYTFKSRKQVRKALIYSEIINKKNL